MINFEFRKYTNCTYGEKLKCVETIKTIIELSNTARTQGILALEEAAEGINDYLTKTALMLVVDGTDPELIRSITDTLITFSGCTEVELLNQLIIQEGILMVQEGQNSRIIELKLMSFLGIDFIKEYGGRITFKKLHENFTNKEEGCQNDWGDMLTPDEINALLGHWKDEIDES